MKSILHVNSSEFAGGVAEMLLSLIHKFGSGYKVKRLVIERNNDFFSITKKIHNDLHGKDQQFSEDEVSNYNNSGFNNQDVEKILEYDVVILHDPQPLPLIQEIKKKKPDIKIIWRCHIPVNDKSFSWNKLMKDYVNMCDHAIFSMEEYVPTGLRIPHSIFTPCIDPYSLKNIPLETDFKDIILRDLGIKKPFMVQISRFDKLKGVEELIRTYNKISETEKSMDFILASNLAPDDPEGVIIYDELLYTVTNNNVKLLKLSDDCNLNHLQVNALQDDASIVLHNSVEEGFGLAVTEAMYKGNTVITRNVGGITLQVEHRKNGFIYDSEVDLIDIINDLPKMEPYEWEALTEAAYKKVRDNFTMDVLVNNYKTLITDITGGNR